MSVVIHGQDEPFGVLSAYTREHGTFSEDDVDLLQAVANVLTTAIEREEAQERVEVVREAERSRIARDLHDDALQDLTDALVKAQRLQSTSKDTEQTHQLERLVASLDRIGPQLRGAIYDLSLEGEKERPFHELLESLVELHHGMAPESDIHLNVQDGILSDTLGENGREVLRIVAEALTNARRHSGTSNVWVGVWTSEGKLEVEVSDDGRSFDPAKVWPTATTTGGRGLRGMHERARALGET
jgi:signal transduction histidine kinase